MDEDIYNPKVKVGDKVKITRDITYHGSHTGKVGTIKQVGSGGRKTIHIIDLNGTSAEIDLDFDKYKKLKKERKLKDVV